MGTETPIQVLDPVKHRRLLLDRQEVCDRSGVPWRYIEQSAVQHCSGTELQWLMYFNQQGLPGLMLLGDRAVDRTMAIAGALIRNFIDARVRTVQQLLDDPVDAGVMLCPNFHTLEAKDMPGWKVERLYDHLLDRFRSDKPTVVWTQGLQSVKADYGLSMADLLSGFTPSKGQ